MKQFKNFYEGTYAKYILPGVLLQSVLIGGGYATGREIYSYGAKFGAMGWISGLTIGGKAIGKKIAMKKSKDVIYLTAKVLSVLHLVR